MAVQVTRAGVALTVGIIVLTGLIAGALYWVKETGEQARREDAIAIAERNLEEQSRNEEAANDGAPSESTDEEAPNDTSTTIPGESSDDAPAGNGQPNVPQTGVSELPATGSEGVASLVAVAALSISVALYVQSRRQLQ